MILHELAALNTVMRLLNVNSYIDSKTGGGTAERTFQMSRSLEDHGVRCAVLTLDTGSDSTQGRELKLEDVVILPLLFNRFFIPRIRWKIIKALVKTADVVHLMGHWSVLNVLVYIAARKAKKPYVVCPAGALPIYGRSKLLKILFNWVIGNKIIRNASGWIAVTSAEFPHFEQYGIPSAKITVIPNGVCEKDFILLGAEDEFRRKHKLSKSPIILFMGRLNTIKGPDLLLKAFVQIKDTLLDFQLVYAGPDEGMKASLLEIAEQNGVADRVTFLGYIGGRDKVSAYHAAKLLVVPSRQEAMSIVALEAGACGTPVLLTDQCGFSEIRRIDPNLEVTADIAGISTGLLHFLAEPAVLDRVAKDFKTFVLEHYTWNSVVRMYVDLYKNILGVSDKPVCSATE